MPVQTNKPRRGIYLLPNLVTTAALFAGFYGVVAANADRFEAAALAIFVAMVLDGLDGRVARLTNTQSEFGVQYDSISDMVCFGVAPALIVFEWSLADLSQFGGVWGKIGWMAAFVYTACAGLRLARFNTQVATAEKAYFQGLPSPSAAALVTALVWVGASLDLEGGWVPFVAMVVTVFAGVLMVSNFRYYSFKEFDFRYRVKFVVVVLALFGFITAFIHLPLTLFAGFFVYALSGPVLTIWLRARHRQRKRESE